MAWLQEIFQHASSWPAFLAILAPLGFTFWKYLKRREAKFYEALGRRERITRRLMEG